MKSIFRAFLVWLAPVCLDIDDVLVTGVLNDKLQIDWCDLFRGLVNHLKLDCLDERDVGGDVLFKGDLGAELFDKGEDDVYFFVCGSEEGYFYEHLDVVFR